MNKVKVIELFAGAGGLGMGVSHAGFETAAVDSSDRRAKLAELEISEQDVEDAVAWARSAGSQAR